MKRSLLILCCALTFFSVGSVAAVAAEYSSTVGAYSAGGVNFNTQSKISNQYTGVHGIANTWVNTGNAHMGSDALLFLSNGALCLDAGMKYAYSSVISDVQWPNCGSGYYYTQGKSAGWNGNGYDYHWMFRTPNMWKS